MRLRHILAGIAGGAASALYLVYNYHPLLINGSIHAAIFSLYPALMFAAKRLDARKALWYLAGALPVHLVIHFVLIRDLAQLMGVSHSLLNFSSLP